MFKTTYSLFSFNIENYKEEKTRKSKHGFIFFKSIANKKTTLFYPNKVALFIANPF